MTPNITLYQFTPAYPQQRHQFSDSLSPFIHPAHQEGRYSSHGVKTVAGKPRLDFPLQAKMEEMDVAGTKYAVTVVYH